MPVTLSQLFEAKLLDANGHLVDTPNDATGTIQGLLLNRLLAILASRPAFEDYLQCGRPTIYHQLLLYSFCQQHREQLLALFPEQGSARTADRP